LDVAGLNPSIDAAAAELAVGADDVLLVVLGDVAGAEASELQTLIDACDRPGIALAPSSDGGTSALVRRPPDVIPARFGRNSAAAHRAAAADANVPCLELALPSLTIDIDDIADVLAFRASPRAAAHTRAELDALDAELPS
jgi:2-phospho-L-lactate guanylyltransferase (CobY/MobA/RfbA family)